MIETPLEGGRVTEGVVRVGDTVRRPQGRNAPFVHRLLERLADRGFRAAPRFLGIDERGREVLSFLPGDVPPDLRPDYSDETCAAAARLIRQFHDATDGAVCHNDLSPCNFVFNGAEPIGIIDFDAAAPGPPVRDVAYALFLWLVLGSGLHAAVQARRARVFLDAYGFGDRGVIVDAVREMLRDRIPQIQDAFGSIAAAWWAAQLEWVEAHREPFEAGL